MRRGRDHLEDLADVDVLVLVEEVLHPLLVVEPALHLDHAAAGGSPRRSAAPPRRPCAGTRAPQHMHHARS